MKGFPNIILSNEKLSTQIELHLNIFKTSIICIGNIFMSVNKECKKIPNKKKDMDKFDIDSIYQFYYSYLKNIISKNNGEVKKEVEMDIIDSITNNIFVILDANFKVSIKDLDVYLFLVTKFESDQTRLNCIEILGNHKIILIMRLCVQTKPFH
jgi:hypothetical protein